MKPAITVYLDTQDYSKMSDPKRTDELEKIRNILLNYSKSKKVKFLFSNLIIDEILPKLSNSDDELNFEKNSKLALEKIIFIKNLCGKNTLLDHISLTNQEIIRIYEKNKNPINVISSDGSWMPKSSPFFKEFPEIKNQVIDLKKINEDFFNEKFKDQKNKSENEIKEIIKSKSRTEHYKKISEFTKHYPIHPKYKVQLNRYFLGEVNFDYVAKFSKESFKDLEWILSEKVIVKDIQEHVRKAGEKRANIMNNFLEILWENQKSEDKNLFDKNTVLKDDKKTLINMLAKDEIKNYEEVNFENSDIEFFCPGINCSIESDRLAFRTSLNGRKEKISPSQFVDALHAIYAPYVDVFRTDRFMVPHVKNTQKMATEIVPSLKDLPEILNKLTNEK